MRNLVEAGVDLQCLMPINMLLLLGLRLLAALITLRHLDLLAPADINLQEDRRPDGEVDRHRRADITSSLSCTVRTD